MKFLLALLCSLLAFTVATEQDDCQIIIDNLSAPEAECNAGIIKFAIKNLLSVSTFFASVCTDIFQATHRAWRTTIVKVLIRRIQTTNLRFIIERNAQTNCTIYVRWYNY